MARIIEARAVISAEDRTSGVFDKIAKKIDSIGKAAKAGEQVEKMNKALQAVQSQMKTIEKFDLSRGGFATARKNFREAQAEVRNLAREMANTKEPSREMERAFKRAQQNVAAASRAYESQKNVLIGNKRAIESMGINVGSAATHQARLRSAVERTNQALLAQGRAQERSERSSARRLAMGSALAAGGAMAAHGVKSGAKATLHTYREFDKERRFGKAVMGLTDAEQAPLVNQAIHMGATTKFNDIQVLEAQRELAARGLNKGQIMGMMTPAANLGMALDLKLPDAVKQMEGALFGFKKDISTLDAALASATRTADVQVKAAKISGMTPEDITQAYKYGATPARMSGVSEETLLAFAGISKKANMGGDESGVAFRALMAAAQSPTRGAKEAMLANGLNFKNYQKNPDSLALSPFVENVAAQYGVKLNKEAQAGLGKIFGNKDLISDPAKFTPAVMSVLGDTLGSDDAKSKRSIAGMANRYRSSSMQGIDVNAYIADLMTKIPGNLQLANAVFGAKQGGRIATALGDPETFKKMVKDLGSADGYAKNISDERMAGFDGAVSRFEGAVKNLETAVGRAFDKDGKGGLLTDGMDWAGSATQWMAERHGGVLAAGAIGLGAAGYAAKGYGYYKLFQLLTTGGGLTASAAALDAAAAALTGAAATLNGGKAVTAATAATTAAGVSGWGAASAALPWIAGAAGGAFGLWAMYDQTRQSEGMTSGNRMRKQRGGSMNDAFRRSFNDDRERLGIPVLGDGNVKAELTGSADVKGEATITVRVEAGTELLRAVEGAKSAAKLSGTLNANGPGSTGRSSPDAGAPWTGAGGRW
ncbi:phage tail tape measure protein [Afipia broomeae]|uniref:Phage tail tape measure protein, TP901 family, core region n=1 Tax=Afipia broomeae ATCC 49717 TaxID=883078 RepID=K8NVK7_9BRAD|nr:phage tail tape measure protein [Afipia broomeae]EKS34342.1 phage tail tape measure protein, TP901 family, core region [Afipia broomeae ATCC 49717]